MRFSGFETTRLPGLSVGLSSRPAHRLLFHLGRLPFETAGRTWWSASCLTKPGARLLGFNERQPARLPFVYLLYLDESGCHVGSPAFVLAGLAVHEHDAWHFQRKLDSVVRRRLPKGSAPADFELHAAEMLSGLKKKGKKKVDSPWAVMKYGKRLDVMRAAIASIAGYECQDPAHPCALFGAVIDRSYKDREERAYEEVLHKFDEMLTRQGNESGTHERGIVIHDKRVIERDVQGWVDTWRNVAGRIGTLTHFTDVPLFSDSRASRLIQAADFISWSLWRYYGPSDDESWVRPLWSEFDNANGKMHGLIHVVPGFRHGACGCPPCASRLSSSVGSLGGLVSRP
jgi:hypothetical protein